MTNVIVQEQRQDLVRLSRLISDRLVPDDEVLDVLLLPRELDDALVDRTLGDEAVDGHLAGLAESMRAVHCLCVL